MAFDLQQLLQQAQDIDSMVNTEDWSSDESIKTRLLLLKPLCESRFKGAFAGFLPDSEYTSLQTYLTNLTNHLRSYISNNHPNYLNQVNASLTQVRDMLIKIPVSVKGDTALVLNKVIEDFKQRNGEIVEKITHEKNTLKEEVETLKKTLTTLSGEITKKNTEVISLTTEFQKQFSEAQEKRGTDFASTQKERETEFTTKETERNTNFETQTEKLSTDANTTLVQIEEIQKKVEAIYGVIGKSSIIGAQKDYADRSAKAARWTFWLAIGIMILVATIVIFPLLSAMIDKAVTLKDIKWEMLLYRLPIAGILLLPSFYLANESKKHRDKEAKYRELEIKMAAITPYFLEISDGASKDNANLPEKDRIKLELAQKLLSPTENKLDNNVVLPPEIVDVIKSAMEIAKKKTD